MGITQKQLKKRFKIWEWLFFGLELNEVKKISEICSNSTKKQFVEGVKFFIILDYGAINDFQIEFSADYTKITKREHASA